MHDPLEQAHDRDPFEARRASPHGRRLDVTRVAAAHVTSVKAKIRELNRLRRALEQLVRACPGKVCIADCGILEAFTGAISRLGSGTSRWTALRPPPALAGQYQALTAWN
jgi:hypothetical protein